MSLTFGDAKKLLAQYQGKGGKILTADQLDEFVLKTLDYLLITGSPGAERLFELCVTNGVVTAPYELETPLKVKVNGKIGNAVSKWFEFRSGTNFSEDNCYSAYDTLMEEPNEFFTAFDLPSGGAKVGVLGTAEEDAHASIIISGKDLSGREIITNHKGAEISGEYLSIRKSVITWSNVTFGQITGVYKTRTVGYAPLYWKNANGVKGYLADYSPADEAPTYRRFKIKIPDCQAPTKITILGKTRLKRYYADNDRIPFDNRLAIEVAGQAVNATYNDRIQVAQQKDGFLQSLVEREANHKRPNNGQAIEVEVLTSAGSIRGLIGSRR